MTLDRLPSVLRNNRFNEQGLVVTPNGLLVPAYVASQLGFNEPGRHYLEREFYPRLVREAGVLPLCPFQACAEYLDLARLKEATTLDQVHGFWNEFNHIIGEVNYGLLMPRSKFMVALLDGGHAVDDGLSAEIAHFSLKHGPVVGIRSDFRLGENIATGINAAVREYLDYNPSYGGRYFEGNDAYERGLKEIRSRANRLREAA